MIKTKKALMVLLVIIITLFVLGVVKDQIVKGIVEGVGSGVIGAPLRIGGLSLGLLSGSVRISNLRIYNPKGFSRSILVELPNINISYDTYGFFKGKLHLKSAEIELKEMSLEKNKDGKLNVDELKVAKQENKGKSQAQMPLQIDELRLGIGRLVSRDYSAAGAEPAVNVYDINIHKAYRNITSAQQLAALIMVEPMKAAGIQGAGIYGVAMLAGVAVLPVAVASKFIGKDSAQQDFPESSGRVYEEAVALLKRKGRITREDRSRGLINAEMGAVKITLKVTEKEEAKSSVTVSVRKYFLPQPQIAGGLIYELSEKLK